MRGRIWYASVLILLMAGATACATAQSGTPGVSGAGLYNPIDGNYTQEFSVPLDEAYEATLDAVKALELTAVRQVKDQLGAHVVARRADGTEVELSLRPEGIYWTKVTIEVGRGDEAASVRIAQELERRLKLMRR